MIVSTVATVMALGLSTDVQFAAPDFDRWNYGFNNTPGSRSVGSTFSAYQSGYPFDDRDGQVLIGFITSSEVESGQPPSAYRVTACSLTLAIASDDIPYDGTLDSVASFDPDGSGDDDAGRPSILNGVGFRNGWDGWSFGEDGNFGEVMASGVRNAFPFDFDFDGLPRDISNNLTDDFDPVPWSVGQINDVAPGEIIPAYSIMNFEVDVSDPDIQCYIRTAMADGLLEFMITSLHPASEPGSGGESNYPDWVLKENPLVKLGVTTAPGMLLSVEIVEPSGVAGDVSGDGWVNVEDLLATLAAFGRCPCCPEDSDGSGVVDVDDLLAVIGNWNG